LKKLLSIVLIAIIAFPIFGVHLYFAIANKKVDATMQKNVFAQNFDENELITVKVPAKMVPYHTNAASFEIANGEVEVNGQFITFVKRRIYNDSIEYKCISNTAKTNLQNTKNKVLQLFNDFENSKNTSPKKAAIKPFSFEAIDFNENNFSSITFTNTKKRYSIYSNPFLPNQFLENAFQPPKVG
jgi:hypothetical protein